MSGDHAQDFVLHMYEVGERLESKLQDVLDGLARNRELLDKLSRENTREHDETRSLIRLTFGDLGRRVSALEGRTDSVEARVDRLESRAS